MQLTPGDRRATRIRPLGALAAAVFGTVTFLGAGCAGGDDAPTPVSDIQYQLNQEEAQGGTSNQTDQGDRTQIPGQQGAGQEGGGVPRATVGSSTPGSTGTPLPGRGPAGTATGTPGTNSPAADAAQLASDLSAGLQAHVYLTALMAEAVRDGDQAKVDASKGALAQDTQALAASLSAVAGRDVTADFSQRWQRHLDLYERYARAKAGNDGGGANSARSDLQASADELAAFLQNAVPRAETAALQQLLRQHAARTADTIDRIVAKDPAAVSMTRDGARTMADFAKVLLGTAGGP